MQADQVAPDSDAPTDTREWTVFDAMPKAWPADLAEDLKLWKQGDILTGIAVTWMMPPGFDDVTSFDNDVGGIRPAEHPDLQIQAAIICSQTCDIGAVTPGNAHPFVLIAPLLPDSAVRPSKLAARARQGKVGYLHPTLPPVKLEDTRSKESWYTDLRLIVPVSKSILRGRTPVKGFANEMDSLSFAETLAQKFRRASASDHLTGTLAGALRKFVQDRGPTKPTFTKIEQVRLLELSGDRLNSTRAQLFVYTEEGLSEGEDQEWRALDGAVRPPDGASRHHAAAPEHHVCPHAAGSDLPRELPDLLRPAREDPLRVSSPSTRPYLPRRRPGGGPASRERRAPSTSRSVPLHRALARHHDCGRPSNPGLDVVHRRPWRSCPEDRTRQLAHHDSRGL